MFNNVSAFLFVCGFSCFSISLLLSLLTCCATKFRLSCHVLLPDTMLYVVYQSSIFLYHVFTIVYV